MAAPCGRLLGRRGRDAHLRLGSRRRRRAPRRLSGWSRLGVRHHSLRRSQHRAHRSEPAARRHPALLRPARPRARTRRCGTSTRISTACPTSDGPWSSVGSSQADELMPLWQRLGGALDAANTSTAIRLSFDRLAGDLSVAPYRVTAGAVFDLVTPDPNDPDAPPTTDMRGEDGLRHTGGRGNAADAMDMTVVLQDPPPAQPTPATWERDPRRSTASAAIPPPRWSRLGPSRR